MNYDNIPKQLKETSKWCCWKYEKKLNNNKLAKVPKNPIIGFNASVNKESTFISFDEAIKYADKYDGIGIRVSDLIIAGDIDGCIKEGKLNDLASDVLSKFPSTYFEYSPSRKGLRFFLKLPKGFNYDIKNYKMKNGKLEVYVAGHTNRFVTVTGNVYQNGDITEDKNALKWLLDTYLKRNNIQNNSIKGKAHKSYLSDEEVIKKASSAVNADKFNALYYACDISSYKSHSEADIALSSILAFYCGGDYEQIDRLFRNSAMYRDKWNEMHGSDTYGNITIKNAVKSLSKFYEPIKTVSADIDFNDELSRLKSLNYPLENSL